MAGRDEGKHVILRMIDILKDYSDEEHSLNATAINKHLEKDGLNVERKTIYRNIAAMERAGYDILRQKGGFALGNRQFEVPEVRLLMDAVQSANFITRGKTRQLIAKLGKLLSNYQFKELKKQVFIDYRQKCNNESVYYSIDAIMEGINRSKKIAFQYLEYDDERKPVPRYEGRIYEISPYALVWVNDYYYFIGNMDKYDNVSHFRVDRLHTTYVMDEPRRAIETIPGFEEGLDASHYIKGRFAMFSGDEVRVQLRFHKSLRSVVYDKFTTEVTAMDEGEAMLVTTTVLADNAFFAWMFMLGDRAEIVSPDSVRDMMQQRCQTLLDTYRS